MQANTRYRWENKINGRYYEAWLSQDLLGDWVVTRVNGSLKGRQSRVRHTWCESEAKGVALLYRINRTRRSASHGYHSVTAGGYADPAQQQSFQRQQ